MATKSTITIEGEEVEIYLGNDGKPLTVKLDGKEVYAKEDGKTPLLDDFDAPINVAVEEANNEEKIDIANLFVDRLKNPTSNKPAADSQSEKPAVGKLNIAALQGGAVSALMGQRTANLDEPKGNSAAPDIAQGQAVKANDDPAKPSQNPSASAPPPPPPPPPLTAAPLAPRTTTPKPSNVTAPAAPAPKDNSLEIGLLKQRLSKEYGGAKIDPQEGEDEDYTPKQLAEINQIRQKIAVLNGKVSSAPEATDFTAQNKQDTAAAAAVLSNMLNNRLVQPPPAMVQQNVSAPTSSASVTAATENASPTAPGAIPTPPPLPNWGKPPTAPATTTTSVTATDEAPKSTAENEQAEVEAEAVATVNVATDPKPVWNGGVAPPTDIPPPAPATTTTSAVTDEAPKSTDQEEQTEVEAEVIASANATVNEATDPKPVWNAGVAPPADIPPSPPPTTTPGAYKPSDQAIALGLGGKGEENTDIQKKLSHAARVFDEMRSTENIYQERIALVNEELKQKMLSAYDTGRVTDDEKAVCSKEALSKLLDSIMAINEISKKMCAALDIPDIKQFEALVKESVDLYANYTIAFKIPPNSISRDDFDPRFKGANDANSLLSAPMQRFLKYPLLCRELISDLQPTHPTFAKIKSLSDVAIDGAAKINEAKRSAENISSENVSKTQKLSDKLAKLSTGSRIDKPENLLLRDIAKQFSDQNNNGEKINLAKALANIYMERSGQSRSDYMKIISKGLQVPGFTKAEIKAAVKASTDPTSFASFIPSASEELESAVKKSSERQSMPPPVASAPSDENTDPNAQKSARNQAEDKPKKGSFFQKIFTGNRRKSAPGAVETTLPAEPKAPARPANEAPPTPLAASVPPPSADVQDNVVKPTRAAPVPAASAAPPPAANVPLSPPPPNYIPAPPPTTQSATTAADDQDIPKPNRPAPVPPPAESAPPPAASAPSADVQDNVVKPTRAAPVPAATTSPPPPTDIPPPPVASGPVRPATSSPATPPPVASAPPPTEAALSESITSDTTLKSKRNVNFSETAPEVRTYQIEGSGMRKTPPRNPSRGYIKPSKYGVEGNPNPPKMNASDAILPTEILRAAESFIESENATAIDKLKAILSSDLSSGIERVVNITSNQDGGYVASITFDLDMKPNSFTRSLLEPVKISFTKDEIYGMATRQDPELAANQQIQADTTSTIAPAETASAQTLQEASSNLVPPLVDSESPPPKTSAPPPDTSLPPPPPPPPPPAASATSQPAAASPTLTFAQQVALKAQEKSLASNQQKQQAAAKKADEANPKSFGELYKEDLKNVLAQTKNTFENMGVPKDEYEAFAQLFEILMNLFALATSPASQLVNAGFQKAWAAAKEKYHDSQAEKQGEKFKDPKEQEERLARLDKLIGKSDEKIESLKAEIDKAGPDSRKGQKLSRELEFEQAKQGLLTEARDNTAKHLATLTQDNAVHLNTAPTDSATADADNDEELLDILTAEMPDPPENAVENSRSTTVTTAPVVLPPPPQPLREVALTRLDASVENQFFNAILNQDHEHLSMLARDHDSNLVYPDITLINIAKAFGNQEAVKILKDNGADAAYAERVDLTKQFGHVLNLSGKVDDQIRLKDGSVAKTQNNAEFGRAFHAMAFFEQHFQHFNNKNNIKTPFSNQVNEAVKFAKEHYNKADKHDFAAFYDRIANQPNKPTYLPSGHSSPGGDNHNVGIICYNGYLIVCDGGNQNNIAIYNVGDFKKDDIQKLLNAAGKTEYKNTLKEITQGKAVETIPSNGQQFNNCTYINLAGAVQGLNYVQKCEANMPKPDATQAEKDAANEAARNAAKQERNQFNHASKDAMVGQVQALMDKPNNRAYAIQLMKGFAKKYEDKRKIGPHAFDRFKEFFAKLNNEERKAFLKDTKIPFNNAQNDDLAKLPRRLPNLPPQPTAVTPPPGPPQRFADAQKPPPKRKSDNDAAVDAVLDTGAKPPLTPMQNRSSSSAITQVSQQNLSELLAALDSVEEKKLPKMGIRDYQKVETTDGKLSHVNINMFCTSDKTANGKVTEVKAETKPGSDGVTYSVKGGLVGKEREQTIEQICALAVETAKPGTVLSIPTSDPLKKATIEAALDKAFTEKYGDKYQKGNYTVPDAPKASAGLNK